MASESYREIILQRRPWGITTSASPRQKTMMNLFIVLNFQAFFRHPKVRESHICIIKKEKKENLSQTYTRSNCGYMKNLLSRKRRFALKNQSEISSKKKCRLQTYKKYE